MSVAKPESLRGKLLRQESLARYTSWRVGGVAERFFQPLDRQDLLQMIASLPAAEPVFFIGLGSNILIRDGGIKGTVIHLQRGLTTLRVENEQADQSVIYAEAGVSSSQLARFAAKQGLTGAEFFAGIPGTVGGALAMNAGAFGSETWQFVEAVETVDRDAVVHNRYPKEFEIAYRSVKRPDNEWFLAAYYCFKRDTDVANRERVRELLNKRSATQPIGSYSCGSVFRNPPGDHAARLIESCGLKGYRIGGAEVSEKHANFIINAAQASAKDIEQLIKHVQSTVEAQTNVKLQTEVIIVGEPQ